MKKLIFSILFLIIISSTVCLADITNLHNLKTTFVSQSPDPVEPGKVVEIRWKVENIGSGTAEDVKFELLPEFPFSLYRGEAVQDLGVINGRQTGPKGVIVLYKVKVDERAVEGTEEIKVRYETSDTPGVLLDPFDINIQTIDATLAVTSVSVEPKTIIPGKQGKITITLKNLADSLLKDITTKLDLTSATLPFAPVNSVTEKKIKMIRGGETVTQEYEIVAFATAESMIYKLPLEIAFYDSLGTKYNSSDIIGVKVGDEPDLSYLIGDSTIFRAGSKGEVSIKFVNKGVTDMKFLNVKLKPSEHYQILSAEEEYLGNIDSDDYETADYELYVNPTAPKDLKLPLEFSYKDANNNEFTKEIELTLKLYSIEEAQKFGMVKKSNALGTIITIIVVVVGFIGYRIWKKRKKKK